MWFKSTALAIVAIGLALFVAGTASAADLADTPRRVIRAQTAECPPWGLSTIAGRATLADIQAEVSARYADAGMNTEIPPTVFNRSPRLVWAFAARNACGIALGHLASGEVNHERLWNCECYHARMSRFPLSAMR